MWPSFCSLFSFIPGINLPWNNSLLGGWYAEMILFKPYNPVKQHFTWSTCFLNATWIAQCHKMLDRLQSVSFFYRNSCCEINAGQKNCNAPNQPPVVHYNNCNTKVLANSPSNLPVGSTNSLSLDWAILYPSNIKLLFYHCLSLEARDVHLYGNKWQSNWKELSHLVV